MDTSCQYAANCPVPPAPPAPPSLTHIPLTSATLPYTGLSIALFVGLAVALVALGLLIRYSERALSYGRWLQTPSSDPLGMWHGFAWGIVLGATVGGWLLWCVA